MTDLEKGEPLKPQSNEEASTAVPKETDHARPPRLVAEVTGPMAVAMSRSPAEIRAMLDSIKPVIGTPWGESDYRNIEL